MSRYALLAAGFALAAALSATPASAKAFRTFVSGQGNDSNNCTCLAPCRNFARAITVTNAGGEITVLDPAGYGPVTIDKSISIINDGVGEAGVLLNVPGNAITINGHTGDIVMLRGLTIDGAGAATHGIDFTGAGSLAIENCTVRHFTADGVYLEPSGLLWLMVSHSVFAHNNANGFAIESNAGSVNAAFHHTEFYQNGADGLLLFSGSTSIVIDGTVSNSIAHQNHGVGLHTLANNTGGKISLAVVRSTLSGNGTGLLASVGSVYLAGTMITHNNTGWSAWSGVSVFSYGDNYIDNDAFGGDAAPTPIGRK